MLNQPMSSPMMTTCSAFLPDDAVWRAADVTFKSPEPAGGLVCAFGTALALLFLNAGPIDWLAADAGRETRKSEFDAADKT